MTKLIEKYPIRMTITTVVALAVFLVGSTRVLTQDRDKAYTLIVANAQAIERMKEDSSDLAKLICDVRDEMEKADKELNLKSHANELAYMEIKTKLAGVEALLVKIDKKLP